MSYEYKTIPFDHQDEEFKGHWSDRARGLLWEMGTGKTKVTIDEAAALHEAGQIDALIVVAPDGVHRNWITDELPAHLPDRVARSTKSFAYLSEKASTRWHREACDQILAHPGLITVAMSYDSVSTEPLYERNKNTGARSMTWKGGKRFLWDLLSNRKVMYVADESRRIKNPKADRTKVVVKSSVYAPYRRILNGTPVPNGPFDLYSQLQFLDQSFWHPHGIQTYGAFKQMFGVFKKGQIRDGQGKLREFDQLVEYRNLDLLNRILGTVCSRKTKDEVLNLPPKLYSRCVFDLTAGQRKVYESLKNDFMAYLDTGDLVTAPLAITRLLRFQQITSGFIPVPDGEEPIHQIGSVNPRMDLVKELAEDMPHKAIWWARWNQTVDSVMDILRKTGRRPVQYDGRVNGDARAANKRAFQDGDATDFVAKASTAGEGLTLHAARTVVYVENTFDLAERLQSEDRAHRIGQLFPVNYIDLVALNTVDEKIVEALIDKYDVANQITGDKVKDWLGQSQTIAA